MRCKVPADESVDGFFYPDRGDIVSLSGKKEAKRTALIHLYVNIFGSIVIAIILLICGDQIAELIKSTVSGDTPEHVMSRAVANGHTIFKIFQVIIMYPFAKPIVKLG